VLRRAPRRQAVGEAIPVPFDVRLAEDFEFAASSRPACLEDALPVSAVGRRAGERRLAASCAPATPVRSACSSRSPLCRRGDHVSRRRRTVFVRIGGDRARGAARPRLALLHLHRRGARFMSPGTPIRSASINSRPTSGRWGRGGVSDHSPSAFALARVAPGGLPITRLKARLKAACEP